MNITKELMCVSIRGGVEIWVEKERIRPLLEGLNKKSGFVEVDGQYINLADVVGIFDARTMEEVVRRKNGEWKCGGNRWHARGEKCFCGELSKYKTFENA